MASERIRRSRYTLAHGPWRWEPSPTGDHISLPLDPSLYDSAALAVAELVYFDSANESEHEALRAAIAAYANHVAGGGA